MTLILLGSQIRIVLPVLQAAHAMGSPRVVVFGTQETRQLRWSPWVRRHVLADFGDLERSARQLEELAREQPQAVLVPCDCPAIRLLHRLGARVPLATTPLPTPQALKTLDDKWRFHLLCEASALPVPPAVCVAGKHQLDFTSLAATLGLPFVVKPTNASGSLGVVVVRSGQDLLDHVVLDRTYGNGPLIVQRYIDGRDIDVDLFAVDGELRAVTTHEVKGCWMEFTRHPVLEEMAAALCRATRYSGPMNLDARIEQATGRIFLLESNPRFWASLAIPAACGLNFLAESLRTSWPAGAQPRRPALARCNRRHPLLRPRDWWRVLADRGSQGRLVRTMLFDPYTACELAASLPAMGGRAMQRSWRRVAGAVRSAHAPGALPQ